MMAKPVSWYRSPGPPPPSATPDGPMTDQLEPDARPCTKCGIRPRQPGQRRCKECHAEYMRDYRLQQTTIRLEPDVYEYLRVRGFNEHTSISKLIIQAVRRQMAADQADAEGHRPVRLVPRETKRA